MLLAVFSMCLVAIMILCGFVSVLVETVIERKIRMCRANRLSLPDKVCGRRINLRNGMVRP